MSEFPEGAVKAQVVPIESLTPGSVVFVTVGLEFDDAQGGPWIPSPDDLEYTRSVWENILPEGIKLVVAHLGHEIKVLENNE